MPYLFVPGVGPYISSATVLYALHTRASISKRHGRFIQKRPFYFCFSPSSDLVKNIRHCPAWQTRQRQTDRSCFSCQKSLAAFPSCARSPPPRQIEFHEAFVDLLLDHANVDQRFPAGGMAQNPLQAHHVAGHLVIVIAEGLPQRVAADVILNPGSFGNRVDDLIGPLPGDGAYLVRGGVPLLALQDVFVPGTTGQQAIDHPSCVRIDKDAGLLASLLRPDLGIVFAPQVLYLEAPYV